MPVRLISTPRRDQRTGHARRAGALTLRAALLSAVAGVGVICVWSLIAVVGAAMMAGLVSLSGSQAQAASTPSVQRVSSCGTMLCSGGLPFVLHMGSINGESDPADATRRATALGLNILRLTDFLDKDASITTGPWDESRWAAVDRLIVGARKAGLHVELDLSTYRNTLLVSGLNPYTYDWSPFLTFVANRRNTVSGVLYKSDSTIALVAIAGEVEPINSGSNTFKVTTSQLTSFYSGVLSTWATLAPQRLVTSGGLLQLDWNSGIDWKAIMALPHNDVPAIHVYSDGDRRQTVPAVAAYTASIGRPWIIEEFGFEANLGDATRAMNFDAMYALNRQYHSAGAGLWNVGPETTTTYDVGPQFPLVSTAVLASRPK